MSAPGGGHPRGAHATGQVHHGHYQGISVAKGFRFWAGGGVHVQEAVAEMSYAFEAIFRTLERLDQSLRVPYHEMYDGFTPQALFY